MFRWLRNVLGRSESPEGASPGLSPDDIQDILLSQKQASALPNLDLEVYRRVAQSLPAPTAEQIEAFSVHVSEAKSWYKHLPLLPPGAPFTFFIDPWAGMDRVLEPGGRATHLERTDETPKFHYTWMTTNDYRTRFAHLGFASTVASELFLPVSGRLGDGREFRGVLANNPSRAAIDVAEARELQLPEEVLKVGTVEITGVIHERAASKWVWKRFLDKHDASGTWPDETGGPNTLRRIRACLQSVETGPKAEDEGRMDAVQRASEELRAILAPERDRLRREMVSAMNRMIALLYGDHVSEI